MLNPSPSRFDGFVDPGKLAVPAAVCVEVTAVLMGIGDDVLGVAGARLARFTEDEAEGALVSGHDDAAAGTAEVDLRFQCMNGFSYIRQPLLTVTRHSSPSCSVSGWVEILVMKDSAVLGDKDVVVIDLESTVDEGGDGKANGGGRFLVAALIAEVSMAAVTYLFGAATHVILPPSAGDLAPEESLLRSIAMGAE